MYSLFPHRVHVVRAFQSAALFRAKGAVAADAGGKARRTRQRFARGDHLQPRRSFR